MELDRTQLDRLLSLDDRTLARTIAALSQAAGLPRETAEAAVSDLRRVRYALGNADSSDVQRAAQLLGEERLNALLQTLGTSALGGGPHGGQ